MVVCVCVGVMGVSCVFMSVLGKLSFLCCSVLVVWVSCLWVD